MNERGDKLQSTRSPTEKSLNQSSRIIFHNPFPHQKKIGKTAAKHRSRSTLAVEEIVAPSKLTLPRTCQTRREAGTESHWASFEAQIPSPLLCFPTSSEEVARLPKEEEMFRNICVVLLLQLTALNSLQSLQAQNRVNWRVAAVRKAKPSIVTIKVVKPSSTKDIIGTGVIIDERGYVITNYHVIRNYVRIKTYLSDGTYLHASVHATLENQDLAVLKISSKKPLQALPLGPARDLMQGEDVLAIGHPFGYQNTVSTGIISYVGRDVPMPSGITLRNLIQITADINPGNSGGALLNVHGELIGINVALRKGAQGIAFALNADDVQRALSQHLSAREMNGVRHGLKVQESIKSAEGSHRQEVVVQEVASSTPAAKAGLKKGDVILSVGKRAVGNRFDVERSLWKVETKSIPVTINRNGLELELDLELPIQTVSGAKGTTSVHYRP